MKKGGPSKKEQAGGFPPACRLSLILDGVHQMMDTEWIECLDYQLGRPLVDQLLVTVPPSTPVARLTLVRLLREMVPLA